MSARILLQGGTTIEVAEDAADVRAAVRDGLRASAAGEPSLIKFVAAASRTILHVNPVYVVLVEET